MNTKDIFIKEIIKEIKNEYKIFSALIDDFEKELALNYSILEIENNKLDFDYDLFINILIERDNIYYNYFEDNKYLEILKKLIDENILNKEDANSFILSEILLIESNQIANYIEKKIKIWNLQN